MPRTPPPFTEQLIRRVVQGDADATRAFYRGVKKKVHATLARNLWRANIRSMPRGEQDDLTHEVALKLWRGDWKALRECSVEEQLLLAPRRWFSWWLAAPLAAAALLLVSPLLQDRGALALGPEETPAVPALILEALRTPAVGSWHMAEDGWQAQALYIEIVAYAPEE